MTLNYFPDGMLWSILIVVFATCQFSYSSHSIIIGIIAGVGAIIISLFVFNEPKEGWAW